MNFGVYIHIPYCKAKCRYCDFYSIGKSAGVPDAYLHAVLRELDRFSGCGAAAQHPETLYLGGGTPSLLTPAQAARLIDAVAPVPGAEITLEANPETVTIETLRGFRAAGVNRISFGVQTASDASLARLGRAHTAQASRRALINAARAGFTNISADVMLALPGYTLAELDDTLALLDAGGCTHISSYLLKIEPGTYFGRFPPSDLPDEDAAADFYLAAVEKLAQRGFVQYEISNFARPGYEGRHNLIYWNCGDYLGIGPTAHSCMNGRRFAAPAGLRPFLRAPVSYAPQGICTAQDYIMLQLRLRSGLALKELEERYGVVFTSRQTAFMHKLVHNEMADFKDGVFALTPRGMLIQNSILCELI